MRHNRPILEHFFFVKVSQKCVTIAANIDLMVNEFVYNCRGNEYLIVPKTRSGYVLGNVTGFYISI